MEPQPLPGRTRSLPGLAFPSISGEPPRDLELKLNRRQTVLRCSLVIVASLGLMAAGGCQFFGFLAQNYQENTPKKVAAEYYGLAGQSFTVVVRAERSVLADFPGIADAISIRMNEGLRANLPETGEGEEITGYIPPAQQLVWLSNHPRWRSMMPSELGESLQVSRLVMVELHTFRLHQPGNRFIWDGEASASVRVFEIDSVLPDDAVFESEVRVAFPTTSGRTSNDYTATQVSSVLLEYFSRRSTWLMFDHEEKRDLEY